MAGEEPTASENLLPHSGVARLLTRVIEVGPVSIACEGAVSLNSPYLRAGRCPAWMGIELAAQAAALLELLPRASDALEGSPSSLGYIVRLRGIRCARSFFQPESPLTALATRLTASPPLFVYAIRVADSQGILLEGQISMYLDLAARLGPA